ncbi:MAG: class I SAM-dependent methyltransferase [Paracoccaceae bacterium]|nr:class I SAM-dependent methyltransferase [Paracoccaceae bacterium]
MGLFKKKKKYFRHPDFPVLGETSYQKVLSAIESENNVEWYLEIGSRSGASVARRNCSYIAVDPEFKIAADVFNSAPNMIFCQQISDDFFKDDMLGKLNVRPDLTFIDGMHLFEFALRDFINAEKAMGTDGAICVHDVCPFSYEMTTRDVSYLEKGLPWTGDVWKVIMVLLEMRPDLQIDVLNAHKTGLGCVRNLDSTSTVLQDNYDEIMDKFQNLELESIGAEGFYGLFELRDAQAFINSLSS